ncbi:PTS sugar transporter subunit IIA [Vagococcus sp. BWB3-3]|uniref:Mannitol-specific phosphotransferase enzyme IIA component n=1 Tax=Vagococcus allomyrinae TaxID=2794353 RepID=A0A940P9P9_9ENTE|nr:PTS sugar transporter subunit IIA [Vagococcus allomyrinae]
MEHLQTKAILLNQEFATKKEAIEATGQALLECGYIQPEYIATMHERDQLTSTFIGNMVAIPHGTDGSQQFINQSGLVVLQAPAGVSFDGNPVKLLIGIAGVDGQHLALLSKIAIVCSELTNVEAMVKATSPAEIIALFEGVEENV